MIGRFKSKQITNPSARWLENIPLNFIGYSCSARSLTLTSESDLCSPFHEEMGFDKCASVSMAFGSGLFNYRPFRGPGQICPKIFNNILTKSVRFYVPQERRTWDHHVQGMIKRFVLHATLSSHRDEL